MNKADALERFVVKAGYADAETAAGYTKTYKTSPDAQSLTFAEWAVMSGSLSPDQSRTVQEFFDNSRFQCLECGKNVYGREFTDPIQMVCPHCSSREFQIRGTARSTQVLPTGRANAAPSLTDASTSDTGSVTTVSRAPKLPGSGESLVEARVVGKAGDTPTRIMQTHAAGSDEGKRRPVPLEALQVLKGRSLDDFLKHLAEYPLAEWRPAMTLIAGFNRRDLVPAALADGRARLQQLATLSLLTRSLPRIGAVAQAFVFELLRETSVSLALLGAFLAHREKELERPLRQLSSGAVGSAAWRDAQQAIRREIAGDASEMLEFFLDTPQQHQILSGLQGAHGPGDVDIVTTITDFLASPEPFVRALVAYAASDTSIAVPTDQLEGWMQMERDPFVTATLQTTIDRRQGVYDAGLSRFEIVMLLKETRLFASLTRDNLISVAGVAVESNALAGDTIIEQDTPGDSAFILVEGTVDVVRTQNDGTDKHLAMLTAPHVFGEMAILH